MARGIKIKEMIVISIGPISKIVSCRDRKLLDQNSAGVIEGRNWFTFWVWRIGKFEALPGWQMQLLQHVQW